MKSSAYLTHRPWSQGLKRHRWGKLEEMNDLFSAAQLAVWFIFPKLYLSALRDYHPHNFSFSAPHVSSPPPSTEYIGRHGKNKRFTVEMFWLERTEENGNVSLYGETETGWLLIPPVQSKTPQINCSSQEKKITLTIFSSLEQRPLRPMQLNKFDENVYINILLIYDLYVIFST